MGNENVKNEGDLGYTESLDFVVVALCAAYDRRRRAGLREGLSRRVLMEYEYLDILIREGADEIVGPSLGEIFIREIGSRIGYAKSSVDRYSESVYKQLKLCIKLNVARKLHLL